MKEELQNKATQILDMILHAVNVGIDKAPEFLGGLAKEYVFYLVTPSIAWFLFSFFIGSVGLFGGLYCLKKANSDKSDWHEKGEYGTICFACLMVSVFSLAISTGNLIELLQAYYAPQAFLIESLRK